MGDAVNRTSIEWTDYPSEWPEDLRVREFPR